jgi:hypothetical protein
LLETAGIRARIRRVEAMEEENKIDSLDRLFDDFNRKTEEQFKDILSKIDSINSKLRLANLEKPY